MEIGQLQHFATVAQFGNFGRAAEELHVTQSALSKSIKRLESFIGATLFERTTRGVQLTVYGRGLLNYANVILNERNRAISMMSAIKGRAVGNLVIGVSKHLGGLILPDAVNRLISAFPGVWVEVIEGYTDELSGLLLNGSADLLFVGYKEQAHTPALVYEKLLDSDSVIIAHPSHPLAKKASVTRAELMKARWILTVEKSSIFQFYNSLDLEGSEYDPSNLPILSSSAQFTARMIRSGGFIAISGRHAVADDLAAGKLAEVRGPIRKRSPNIGIVLRRKGYRSPMLVRLIKEIRSVAKGR